MAQQHPQVTPWTGNPVITGYIVSGIVAGIVYLARSKGHEIDPHNQNILIELLSGPIGELVAFLTALAMAVYSRMRASSELTVAGLMNRIDQLQSRV